LSHLRRAQHRLVCRGAPRLHRRWNGRVSRNPLKSCDKSYPATRCVPKARKIMGCATDVSRGTADNRQD
jgi:hypothetical protein